MTVESVTILDDELVVSVKSVTAVLSQVPYSSSEKVSREVLSMTAVVWVCTVVVEVPRLVVAVPLVEVFDVVVTVSVVEEVGALPVVVEVRAEL